MVHVGDRALSLDNFSDILYKDKMVSLDTLTVEKVDVNFRFLQKFSSNKLIYGIRKYFDGFFAPALVALFAVVVGCIFYSLIEKPLTVYLRKNIVEKMFLPKAHVS